MIRRGELWFTYLATDNPASSIYRGKDKRALIVSNDSDNNSVFPTVAIVPRRTRSGRTESPSNISFPGTVESPWNEPGCNKAAHYDCMHVVMLMKVRGHQCSYLKERIGQVPPGRMVKVEAMLSAVIAKDLPAEVVALNKPWPANHHQRWRRGSLVTVLGDDNIERPAMIIGNDEVRARVPFPVAVAVYLRELSTGDDEPVGRTVVRLNKKSGRERKFIVFERTVRTIDIYLDIEAPSPLDTIEPPCFDDRDMEAAVLAVERYLGMAR